METMKRIARTNTMERDRTDTRKIHHEAPAGTPCNCGVRSEQSSRHDLYCPVYLYWATAR